MYECIIVIAVLHFTFDKAPFLLQFQELSREIFETSLTPGNFEIINEEHCNLHTSKLFDVLQASIHK